MKLTDGKGADAAIVAGGGAEALNNAIAVVKAGGGNVAMPQVITETEMLQIPNAYIGGFLSHKTIRGGLCPGGRKRIERLLAMVKAGRVDPSKMITHRFTGLESIEEAFYIMANKPRNLIKPIVIIKCTLCQGHNKKD